MDSGMRRTIPLANAEQCQEFDDNLVKRLAKVIQILPNMED